MPRVTVDTNLRVSASQFGGKPHELMQKLHPPTHLQIVSEPLLREFERILRDRFRVSPETIAAQLKQIRLDSLVVTHTETIEACRDPDDNRILECAVAGQADYIVTGDRDLLVLDSFRGILILTARQFLDHLSTPSDPLK